MLRAPGGQLQSESLKPGVWSTSQCNHNKMFSTVFFISETVLLFQLRLILLGSYWMLIQVTWMKCRLWMKLLKLHNSISSLLFIRLCTFNFNSYLSLCDTYIQQNELISNASQTMYLLYLRIQTRSYEMSFTELRGKSFLLPFQVNFCAVFPFSFTTLYEPFIFAA